MKVDAAAGRGNAADAESETAQKQKSKLIECLAHFSLFARRLNPRGLTKQIL